MNTCVAPMAVRRQRSRFAPIRPNSIVRWCNRLAKRSSKKV
jgi:hypothetical protein